MSRDQRPPRPVMIDNGPVDTPARRRDDAAAAAGNPDAALATSTGPAWSTIMLWAILFLVACAAGAAGVALMLVAR